MKRIILGLTIAGLVSVFAACDSWQAATLSGRIYDAKTLAPIENATVSDGSYGLKSSSLTNANGWYSYDTWCEEHNVRIEADGYISRSVTVTTPFWPLTSALSLDVGLSPDSK